MTRGRPVAGPASWLLRGFDRRDDSNGGWLAGQSSRPDLVEARTAVHGAIVPRRKRYDGLTPTGPADRGMELAWSLARASALGDRPAGGTTLGVVGQPLAGEECLLAGREAELLGAIATGQATVLVHPLQTLLGSGHPRAHQPEVQRAGRALERGVRAARPGLGPGTHSGEDTRVVKPVIDANCICRNRSPGAFGQIDHATGCDRPWLESALVQPVSA
jgi:hypothetical protein